MDEQEPPLAAIEVESDAVREAWARAGLTDGPSWPDEPRHRLRLPAAGVDAGLDALAAALDAIEGPERVFVHLDIGRRAEFGPRRRTLESLSGHPDVVVADQQTAGSLPLTAETFDALAALYEDIAYALVWDEAGDPVLELRGERLTVALPAEAVATLPLADRVEHGA